MPEPISDPQPDSGGGGIGGALTRKLGPLPAWGWAVAIAGSVIVFRVVRGRGAFPSAGGSSTPVGAVNPVISGSENSQFGSLSASDIADLKNQLGLNPGSGAPSGPSGITGIPPGGPIHYPPTLAPKPVPKAIDFAGTRTAFGTVYPTYVHTLAEAIAFYFRAIANGAKPKTAFSTVPIH